MKDKIKFIHCSDIHLGANPYGIKTRFEDMARVFNQVVDYAVNSDIDFFVIAGDLFDKKNLNAETLNQAIEALKPLNDKNIPIYVTEGNHDMATYVNTYSWLSFMSNKGYIKLLNPVVNEIEKEEELVSWNEEDKNGSFIETDSYIVYGLGYPGILASKYVNNLTSKYIENKDEKIVISMLHTGIDKFVTEGMGGLREEEIEDLINKSDYIALGHIHQEYKNEEKKYFNPGSLENSSIPQNDVTKGFYEVEIDRKTKNIDYKFINVSNRKILNITIDLNDVKDLSSAYEEIIKRVEGILKVDNVTKEDNAIMQIKIKGELESSGTILKLNELKDELKEKFGLLYVEIQNRLLNKREFENMDDITLSREEIDKSALRNLIVEENFEEHDVDSLLDITLKMKEFTKDEELTLSTKGGMEIKDLLLNIVRKKNNKENSNNDYDNNDDITSSDSIDCGNIVSDEQ